MNDPEIARLEAALAGLAPVPARIDRDRLLFQAGRRSARRGRLWPCAAALFALVAGGLGVALAVRPGPQITERIVYVPLPPPAPPVEVVTAPPAPVREAAEDPVSSSERARFGSRSLQQRVLRWGVEGLPLASAPVAGNRPATTVPPPSSYQQMRKSLKIGGEL
jgi:hypothetical protein